MANTLRYPHESAGRLMTEHVPVVGETATVRDIESLLLRKARSFESLNYIYVVDKENVLKGVVSIKEVFISPKQSPVRELMSAPVFSVRAHSDQERAAILALKHSLKAVPVVGKGGVFLGVVPSDVILEIFNKEHVEDLLKTGGVWHSSNGGTFESIFDVSPVSSLRRRLPWLLFGLFGGVVAAVVVGSFEGSLEAEIALAAFIPAVVYIADAVGVQVQTVFIRSLVADAQPKLRSYLLKELRITAGIAVVLGMVMTFVSAYWWESMRLGWILGISVFVTTLAAMTIAVILPWIFVKFRYDPAVASGPFATVVRDILSLFIYFGVANLFL